MGARSKRAQRIRRGQEFDLLRLEQELKKPRDQSSALYSWTLAQIFEARDEQTVGTFVLPARMADAMRMDDALYTAKENRLAPQRCIPVEMKAGKGARGEVIAAEAEALFGQNGVGIRPETMVDIHGCLVDHGVAFGVIVNTPRDDGTRVDSEIKYWPIEYVWWDSVVRIFKARVDPNTVRPGDIPLDDFNRPDPRYGVTGGSYVPIIHGDGRWVIFQKNEINPFRYGAILPAALVWARHAFAVRDWAKGSVSHGSAKVVGELPEGVSLMDEDGNLTQQAAAFVALLQAIGSADSPAGIRPAGSKTDFVVNSSTAWQVWSELVNNGEKAAARIYLGTDGTLGTTGGAPGVDITALFGVASTIVRGDLEALERGLNTGLIEPWCAINFGDSSLSPKRCYKIPNEDENQVYDEAAKRNTAFYLALKASHDAGIALTPEYIGGLAKDFGVRSPVLSAPPLVAVPKPSEDASNPTPAAPSEQGG